MRVFPIAVASVAFLLIAAPASAITDDFGVDIYMSAPTVQGTAILGSVSENFNLVAPADAEDFGVGALGACPATIAIGTVSGDCTVATVGVFGGATAAADDASPTTGGSGSEYATTSLPSQELTINLDEPAQYLGLWWSAGNSSNSISFYSGEERVAYMSTVMLMDLLTETTITNVAGVDYNTSEYFGNPRNRVAISPSDPFLYLNIYGTGGASFDRIVFSGAGFEFDNLAVSAAAQTPGSGEAGVQFIAGENAPAAAPETLAATGFDNAALVALGILALIAGAVGVAVRRRTA